MTHLTVKETSSYFAADADRPAGAIRSLHDPRARDFGQDAVVYEVSQRGYITKYRLLERFHAACNDYSDYMSAHFLPAMRMDGIYGDYYQCFFLEQAGIWPHVDRPVPETSNQFQTFFTLEEATAYSIYLQDNEDYMASVKLWHKECDAWDEYRDKHYD